MSGLVSAVSRFECFPSTGFVDCWFSWLFCHSKRIPVYWLKLPPKYNKLKQTVSIVLTSVSMYVWLNSGLCPDQSKGWITVIIICLCISSYSFTSSDNVEWQQYEFRNLNKEGQEEHGTIRLMCIWIWYKQQESKSRNLGVCINVQSKDMDRKKNCICIVFLYKCVNMFLIFIYQGVRRKWDR